MISEQVQMDLTQDTTVDDIEAFVATVRDKWQDDDGVRVGVMGVSNGVIMFARVV